MNGPKLLVSIRSLAEANIAWQVGVDLLDIKEPDNGSLGAASIETIRQIAAAAPRDAAISVALGELIDEPISLATQLPVGVAYAKVGLAHCAQDANWPARWRRCLDSLPQYVQPVAVVYADASAHAPPSQQIVAVAAQRGCAAVLVDTFDKSAGTLLDCWTIQELEKFVAEVHAQGMMCVLAGSISTASLPFLWSLEPDYLAIRGAVCNTARTGTLDAEMLKYFRCEMSCSRRRAVPA
jgi:uncharacterized protein (UPF0264 family)